MSMPMTVGEALTRRHDDGRARPRGVRPLHLRSTNAFSRGAATSRQRGQTPSYGLNIRAPRPRNGAATRLVGRSRRPAWTCRAGGTVAGMRTTTTPTWPVAAGSLALGFAVAQATGVRPLGGIVLAVGCGRGGPALGGA